VADLRGAGGVSSPDSHVRGLLLSAHLAAAEESQGPQAGPGQPAKRGQRGHLVRIYGNITGITDTVVTLEIAEKVRIKMARSSIAGVIKGQVSG